MLAYVFPGQSSQFIGMGKEYFNEFRDLEKEADDILGYSIRKLCLEDPENQLSLTQYTQPALFLVNAMAYLKKVQETGIKPDYVAGHSLGEYNALFAAEVFDFATGLRLIKKRGELMSEAVNGGMAAVIGLEEEAVREVLESNDLTSIDIANLNSPKQIVLSGLKLEIENAKDCFMNAGALQYLMLKVSGAFHSRYMEPAKKKYDAFTQQFEFHKPRIPVISNVYARPYKSGEIRNYLLEQLTSSVKWTESIRYLMGKGAGDIVQIGPGNVLTSLIRNIKKDASPLYVEDEEISDTEEDFCSIFSAKTLGSKSFKKDYNLEYSYLTGGMHFGIAGKELVKKVGQAGMLGFLGTEGLELEEIEQSVKWLKEELYHCGSFGVNLVHNQRYPEKEEEKIDLFLKYGIRTIEASAYISLTPAIIKYRLKGLTRDETGRVTAVNRIIAKTSRPEVAGLFLSPAPSHIVEKLLLDGKITLSEAELSKELSVAEDLCVETDSAGYSVKGTASTLLPAIRHLKDEMMHKHKFKKEIRVGMAGGIGTPEAIVAAFVMGADFVMTGSINQCTVEAEHSELVKDMLQELNVQDTEYVPSIEMFEYGAKTQVMKKGVLFPVRANKLYEIYKRYQSLEEIDEDIREQIEKKYFCKSFEAVYDELKESCHPSDLDIAENNKKYKMGLIFKWYLKYSMLAAISGDRESVIDYQVNCGPALGAFNSWVKGTELEKWRNRDVAEIGKKLMKESAYILNHYISSQIRRSDNA